jgi:hypothetical protein
MEDRMGGSSGRSRSAQAWPAMRALYEGAEVSTGLLADISGRLKETVDRRAGREGWTAPKSLDAASVSQRVNGLMDGLLHELEAMEKGGRGPLPKARIDALTARMRLLEKLSEINEGRQIRQEEQKKTDAEIADILGRIDARIVELASEFAANLAGDRNTTAAGAAGRE